MQEQIAAIHSEQRARLRNAPGPVEALRWAIDDCGPGPITPGVETEASLTRYRGALLAFHRESKRVRYSKTKDAASQHPRAL